MANCSIPNSTPATGRTSTTWSRRSKKQNSLARSLLDVCWQLIGVGRGSSDVQKRRRAAALQGAPRARKIPRCTLGVQRSAFSFLWRVKGAWWPSRSSKPSSPRKWRGRFDSYPLRPNNCDSCSRFAVRNGRVAHRATATAIAKGGDTDVA